MPIGPEAREHPVDWTQWMAGGGSLLMRVVAEEAVLAEFASGQLTGQCHNIFLSICFGRVFSSLLE